MFASLRVEDPEQRLAAVRLCSDLPLADPSFVREDGGWMLDLPPTGLARLEYQLELSAHDGDTVVVCDPDNPERAPGAFGEKSVLLADGYRPPAWLDAPAVAGELEPVAIRVLGRDITIGIWSPAEGELPLLVAHDGPEYDELAALTRYAGAMIERGAVRPFRVALLPPGDRDDWYSASAAYGRALCNRILPALREHVAVSGLPVGIGASLGGLAMLHAQRTWPGVFAGLFLQSASFFVPRFDRHESRFPRYARIVRFVRRVLRTATFEEPVPVSMTCGAEEENIHNNRLVASALAAQGYDAQLAEVPDLHNYTNWRDALDPHLTRLLAGLWGAGLLNGVAVYGHWGRPVLAFPAERGDAGEFERRGMVGAVGGLIEAGRVKLYCVDSFDHETWSNRGIPLEERARRHRVYESWILDEVVPFVRHDCGGASEMITCGVSLGAFHAANFALKRADVFPLAIGLSGNYDPSAWDGWGERGEAAYFNNPMDYVGNLGGDHLDWLRGRLSLLLVCGQGQWEDTTGALESTLRFAGLLQSKDIRCELDLWGHDVAHDWPSWRAQLAHHLPRFV